MELTEIKGEESELNSEERGHVCTRKRGGKRGIQGTIGESLGSSGVLSGLGSSLEKPRGVDLR